MSRRSCEVDPLVDLRELFELERSESESKARSLRSVFHLGLQFSTWLDQLAVVEERADRDEEESHDDCGDCGCDDDGLDVGKTGA